MNAGCETSPDRIDGRARRQDRHVLNLRARPTLEIAARRPEEEGIALDEEDIALSTIPGDHHPIRQVVQPGPPGPLRAARADSLAVKLIVDRARRQPLELARPGVSDRPGLAEGVVSAALTFVARTMSGRQTRRLVEEEKLGVATRSHDDPTPSPELQEAQEPPTDLPGAPDPAFLVVKDASIAHESPPLGDGPDLAGRHDAVLPRHWNSHRDRRAGRARQSALRSDRYIWPASPCDGPAWMLTTTLRRAWSGSPS